MAFLEENGNIDGIPVPLYWRMVKPTPDQVVVQEHELDAEGNKLDADGLPIIVDEYNNRIDQEGNIIDKECANVQYSYIYPQYMKWSVSFYAYLNKEESGLAKKEGRISSTGKANRKSMQIEFMEPYGEQRELLPTILESLYKNPDLLEKIPEDWVSDEV